ncbi:bifunctional 4-hydroxy-2-oxoglutarate aldolase/2-dehydro-3-deoxy-phosphogluconate aldolase [Kineococcus gynurae]|uniref:2-dehydro-3-deoxy-phosphogluconate aldolase n=1 Tax=Kineococcus gynurae TaxID=452979 RepID=A0ABV5LW84_9ACTN
MPERTPVLDGAGILDLSPVVPVVVLDDPEFAAPLARALAAGGVGVVELTLRTPSALECARRIREEVPEVVLGLGTVLTPADVDAARAVGAQFLVSPGATPALYEAVAGSGLPFLPGTATLSEVLTALEHGHRAVKFFPAEQSGGPELLAAWAAPVPHARFCPTGGIGPESARRYLDLPTVGCVGGSWLTPRDAVLAHDTTRITQLARDAVTRLRTP